MIMSVRFCLLYFDIYGIQLYIDYNGRSKDMYKTFMARKTENSFLLVLWFVYFTKSDS